MKTLMFLALTLFSTLGFAQQILFNGGKIKADLQWEIGPKLEAESVLLLKLTHQNGAPATFAKDPEVEIWMPHMGHGSAPTDVQQVSTGQYRVHDIYFLMAGMWEMKITITDDTGKVETQKIDFDL